MPPETSSFESSSISAGTADMAPEVAPWEITALVYQPHKLMGAGKKDLLISRGFSFTRILEVIVKQSECT